ncbi:MAG: hypothetical protein ABIG68_07605 [Acidobacteriota bacterium]
MRMAPPSLLAAYAAATAGELGEASLVCYGGRRHEQQIQGIT